MGRVDVDQVVWEPTDEIVEHANVKGFMDRHGFDTFEALLEASMDDPAWFWGAVEEDLGLEWFTPYTTVLDDSDGIQWSRWFVDGETNIALNCVDRHARDHPHRDALVWEGEDGEVRSWTYEQLHEETNRLANALDELGVGKGDAVGVYMPMLPETVAALLAICKVGGIFVPLFSGFGADAVSERLQGTSAKVLLTADGFTRRGREILMKEVADEAADRVSTLDNVVVYELLGADVPWNDQRDVRWPDLVDDQPPEYETVPMASEDPWMVIYTSGTTGKPKGTVHVHGGFQVKIMQEVAHQTDLHPEEDILWWFSDMGWIMGPWLTVGGLGLGGTIFLYPGSPDHPHPGRMWEMVERHDITSLGVSPTLIRALMEHGDEHVEKHDLSSLRILGSTGEPWNPEPYMWLLERVGGGNCPIINLSGGTEVGACFLSPTPLSSLKPTSLAHPSLGMDIAVVDEDGNRLPNGEVGELAALSPWPGMTRGLWNDRERYLDTYWSRWEDTWYHGDYASVDEDGFWYLHGRSDDTINVAGKRLGPADVESAVVDTGKVIEAAAVGIPDDVKGNVVHVWAIPHPNTTPGEDLEEELKLAVAETLGKPFKPKAIHFVDDLPRTRNGKILRRGIRNKAIGEDPGNMEAIGNPEALDGIERVG